jgi:NADH-quinone oxidoreductase subunit M
LKRLVAYSSLAHLGFIVIGAFALSREALTGAVLQMVNHGLYTAALFILIALLYRRLGTFSVREMRGLQRRVPVLAGAFTVVMLASIGVPGLNGFVGEFLILAGTFLTHRWWAVVATAGVVLAAVYLLWAYQQAFQGKPTIEPGAIRDLSWREGLTLAPLVILIVLLGIFPGPLLSRIGPSVTQVVTHVEVVAHQRPPQVGSPGVAVRSSGAHQ